ncbi:MAG: sugar phosphorylase, partial [Anaerolineaceae bacterium]|nr:sugar phosphorylase [Anaerolineaceae bacterium]
MADNKHEDPVFLLKLLYGEDKGTKAAEWLQERLSGFRSAASTPPLDQSDAILITYGDQFQRDGEQPLQTLVHFGDRYLMGLVSGLHILPFFPYSSDDGFSVIDYRQVDPALGTWEDISCLRERYTLMFDAVLNHVSVGNSWFKGFLQGEERYTDYFITLPPETDLSQVVRPRTSPLLTCFETIHGPRWVWTTFSADQVDLNYQNPAVLQEIVDILLQYVENGARLIRLDAIAYLWKKIGTTCIHLPETHLVVKFLNALLKQVAPYVLLITETNVAHEDNVSYFGNGHNEAQLVYNFALPPLVLHALLSGDAGVLAKWAAGLTLPSTDVTFFNFLASHDGVGLNPARGILPESEIEAMARRIKAHGGLISSKTNADGSESPYEMNISYFDALSDPNSDEALDIQVKRFLVSQAILLAVVGLPGIYVHSLFGSRNWLEGVKQTGRSRTINRYKFDADELDAALGSS